MVIQRDGRYQYGRDGVFKNQAAGGGTRRVISNLVVTAAKFKLSRHALSP